MSGDATEPEAGGGLRTWLRRYVLGFGLGAASALYGVFALMAGRAYLPSLRRGNSVVKGHHALAVAAAYLCGGLYLLLRFFLHERCRTRWARAQVYALEVLLLVLLIAALLFVLLYLRQVG